MAIAYDPAAGYLITVFRLTNTAFPSVLRRFEFWLFLVLHLAVHFAYRNNYLPAATASKTAFFMDWEDMKVVGAITTFFEVFYTNHCFSRYKVLYELVREMLGNLYDYCLQLRVYVPGPSQEHAHLASRQLIAAVLLFFYELNGMSSAEWGELVRQGLVRPEERDFLQGFAGQQRPLIMLQWSAEAAHAGQTAAKAPANVMKGLVDKLLACRGLQQEVIDTINLPIPFQYFHLLKAMIVINLLLWAYGMGVTDSVFAPFVFFFAALIFMGMMELAAQLSDPFGDDDVDFPVTEWLNEFVENTAMLMHCESPERHIEKSLASQAPLEQGPRRIEICLFDACSFPDSAADYMPLTEIDDAAGSSRSTM
mmetsp:Transcript_103046/g.291325  ORF Transcript_103046/g.291325 Transcript_103046/m.291325 type:complete len:366 (-) Transcript_103046:107-1204(-)